jgi:sugar fermentation stimulation protein A
LTPGTEVLLKEVFRESRKTDCDLIGVFHRGLLISVDSRVPNKLVLEALKKGEIKELSEYDEVKSEYTYGPSRLDFHLSNERQKCLLEVKSCTLVKRGVAMFPDAVTKRGRRHVMSLMRAKKEGFRACILFLVQRGDANVFAPNNETDPEFGQTLRNAVWEGVEVFAYASEFCGKRIILKRRIDVKL